MAISLRLATSNFLDAGAGLVELAGGIGISWVSLKLIVSRGFINERAQDGKEMMITSI
jgi:hypothetical protein